MSDAIRQAAELKPQAVMDAMDAASKAKDGHDGRWSWSTLAKELSDHIVIVQPAPIAGEEELVEWLAKNPSWNSHPDRLHEFIREHYLPIIRAYVAERVKEAVESEREAKENRHAKGN